MTRTGYKTEENVSSISHSHEDIEAVRNEDKDRYSREEPHGC